MPRTGSTAIRTALQLHSEVYCLHECLHVNIGARDPWNAEEIRKKNSSGHLPLTEQQIMDQLASIENRTPFICEKTHGKEHVSTVGLHYNFEQTSKMSIKTRSIVTDWVDKIVAVDRENQYDRWKSWFIAHKTKQWHAWTGSKKRLISDTYKDSVAEIHETVLDESKFEACSRFITRNRRIRKKWLDWVNLKDNCIIDYNTFCKSPEMVLKQVQTFLGLPHETIFSVCDDF